MLLSETRAKLLSMSLPIPSWIPLPPTVTALACPAATLRLGAWESKLTGNIDMTESFTFLMKHEEGIPLIMKATIVPIPLQIIAAWTSEKLSAAPAYAKDPFFASLLTLSKAFASSDVRRKLSAAEAKITVEIFA